MKKITSRFFLLLCMIYFLQAYSQKKDSSFYFLNNYILKKAVTSYEKKIKTFKYKDLDNKCQDLYNLACAYSLSNDTKNAFKCLNACFAIDIKNTATKYLNTTQHFFYSDADFNNMIKDNSWRQFVIENGKYEKKLPDSLFFTLSKLAIQDQALYKEIDYNERKYGLKSKKVSAVWKIKDSLNKENFNALERLGKEGVNVLNRAEVGQFFATRCFLIIQHSDTASMVKYLPVIKSLYDQGETTGENYALLYDRVQVHRYKGVQYYGTQVNSVTNKPYPIKNEINVDKRRKELGMEPLKDYLLKFGIFYTPKR